MIALVGAMFIAMGSASAAGQCRESGGVITLGFGQTCTVGHSGADAVDDIDNDGVETSITNPNTADAFVTITAGSAATTTDAKVKVTEYGSDNAPGNAGPPNGTDDTTIEYAVRVVGLAIVKTEIVGDQDGRVKAGPQITARVTVRSPGDSAEVRVTVPTTGLSLVRTENTGAETTQSITTGLDNIGTTTAPNTDDTDGVVFYDVMVNTAGAPAGEYTITFEVDDNGFESPNPTGVQNPSLPLTVTIGDPGTGLASATLSLGNAMDDLPYTDDDETQPETGTDSATGNGINLVISTLDSLGGKANASAIDQIIVIAPGGDVSVPGRTAEQGVTSNQSGATIREYDEDNDAETADMMDNVGSSIVVNVKKAGGASAKAGMVTVYAIVSGSGGAATTEPLTLNFSGSTTSISVADATDTLRSVNVDTDDDGTVDDDTVTLAVTGADSGGIASDPGSGFSITITDSDGKRVNSDKMVATLGDYAGGKRDVTVTGKGATGAALKAGEYTVKLKKGDLEDTGMFSVAGSAASVTVTASAMSSDSIGDVITVTATVTDADGNAVSGGTSVMFDVSEDTGLAAIGTGHAGKGTKDGEASVRYAVVGAGHSVISATADDATGVIVIDSTAGATEMAMPEEEASVACLSNLAGFATWACGVESSASEIFGLVSGRGATALHLWNGSAWVRYSVVDGTMVPGSSDFMVAENDILYISN